MDKDVAMRPRVRQPQFFARRQIESECLTRDPPVFITMCPGLRCIKRFGKKELTSQFWKAESILDAKKPQQQMIARVTGQPLRWYGAD